ncbi:MAG: site-specific DNA-methyltransferase, partial [Burkholderiales bacterium]|nr:site-specific DNA-methyltransferase [Burkholderiales bacterium]
MPTLDWLNRAEALTSADRVLEPVSAHGNGNADNLLIQGDNLDALKALLPFYRGRVKCIFIDPPYNTRSAFEHYDDNLEHSQWLSMMYPRLVLLRELLSEDGSIWVTIDDNEGHYLKVLMDEVFGRDRFIAAFVWEHDKGGRGDADVSFSHDYVLAYSIDRKLWAARRNLLVRTPVQLGRFRNPDNDPRGPWRQGDDGTAKSGSDKQRFPIRLLSGREVVPRPGRYWAFSKDTFERARLEGRVYFGKNGDRLPIIKRYLSEAREGVAPRTWWPAEEAGTNQAAKRDHLRKLLPEIEPFATPKPEELLGRILHIASNADEIVLDSTLGSGTTAAVAHKMGRRWIGIEMGEHAVTRCLPRLEKVIAGEQGGISESVGWKGGGGFRFMRLGAPMFEADGAISREVRFPTLASYIWMQETSQARSEESRSPLLGVHEGRAIYLLFNGVLGDRRPQSGNVLTGDVLGWLLRRYPHD